MRACSVYCLHANAPSLQTSSVYPSLLVPLFQGGNFDQNYNNRTPVVFPTMPRMTQAYLRAVITGHGSDDEVRHVRRTREARPSGLPMRSPIRAVPSFAPQSTCSTSTA